MNYVFHSHNLTRSLNIKGILHAFIFVYFGLIIVPQWSHILFISIISPQWSYIYLPRLLGWWLIALPIIVLILVLVGVWGFIELLMEKLKKLPQSPKQYYLVRLASFSLLWFGIALALALGTTYLPKKFDPDIWKKEAPIMRDPPNFPTLRQTMVDDLVENVLPHTPGKDIQLLLGKPDYVGSALDNTLELWYPVGNNADPDSEVQCLFIYFDIEGHYQDYYINDNCGG